MNGTFTWGLLAAFCFSFLGSGPVPMPLTATVLWLGQFKMPFVVVGVATLGSLLGWLTLEKVMRGWVQNRPQLIHRIPKAYRQVFLKNIGLWLFLFNALPLPLDFIRFLALMRPYNRLKMALILTVARLIRNTLLVLAGAALAEHHLWFWGGMLVLMLLPLAIGKLFCDPCEAENTSFQPEASA